MSFHFRMCTLLRKRTENHAHLDMLYKETYLVIDLQKIEPVFEKDEIFSAPLIQILF